MKFRKSFLLLALRPAGIVLPAALAHLRRKPQDRRKRGKTLSPPKDDYYELYKLLADTVDQVDRNYVKRSIAAS